MSLFKIIHIKFTQVQTIENDRHGYSSFPPLLWQKANHDLAHELYSYRAHELNHDLPFAIVTGGKKNNRAGHSLLFGPV